MNALIGHTGFVGRALRGRRHWDAGYHRANLDAIRGRRFRRLVCAGLPTDRWLANGNPAGDRSNMMRLVRALDAVEADRFVLVSTIDVYPVPAGVDESTPIDPARRQAYAEHRLELEQIVAARFERCHVLRLPSAFGPGMQRGPLVDLVRARGLDALDPRSVYQWYPIERLADDIDRVVEHDLAVVNLCTEPMELGRLHAAFFDDLAIGRRPAPPVRQEVRTMHAQRLGGSGHFVMDADAVMSSIGAWLRSLGQFAPLD